MFPLICRSCGRKASVDRVVASLRCVCGSDDIDLDDPDVLEVEAAKTAEFPPKKKKPEDEDPAKKNNPFNKDPDPTKAPGDPTVDVDVKVEEEEDPNKVADPNQPPGAGQVPEADPNAVPGEAPVDPTVPSPPPGQEPVPGQPPAPEEKLPPHAETDADVVPDPAAGGAGVEAIPDELIGAVVKGDTQRALDLLMGMPTATAPQQAQQTMARRWVAHRLGEGKTASFGPNPFCNAGAHSECSGVGCSCSCHAFTKSQASRKTAGWSIEDARKVVETQTYATVDGMLLDLFSASGLVQAYDALNDDNKAKLTSMPLEKAVGLVFKLMHKNRNASKTADAYWDAIDSATEAIRSAKTPEEVVAILGEPDRNIAVGEAFWGGDGDELLGALYDAGWTTHRMEASYYWVMKAPNGGLLSYTEGDINIGDNPMCAQGSRKVAYQVLGEWDDRGYHCTEVYLGDGDMSVFIEKDGARVTGTHIPASGTGQNYASAIIDGLTAGEAPGSMEIFNRVKEVGDAHNRSIGFQGAKTASGQCSYCKNAATRTVNGEAVCDLESCAKQSNAEAEYSSKTAISGDLPFPTLTDAPDGIKVKIRSINPPFEERDIVLRAGEAPPEGFTVAGPTIDTHIGPKVRRQFPEIETTSAYGAESCGVCGKAIVTTNRDGDIRHWNADVEANADHKATRKTSARDTKVREVVAGILATNPGMEPARAHLIARKTVERFPAMVATLERTAMPNPADVGVAVGDFFVDNWGYDQTNIDFYEVVGLTGASVKVRKVRKNIERSDGSGSDYVTPIAGAFTEEPQTKRVKVTDWSGTQRVYLNSTHGWCEKWEGQPERQTSSGWGH